MKLQDNFFLLRLALTENYNLALLDALPISDVGACLLACDRTCCGGWTTAAQCPWLVSRTWTSGRRRSEEYTSVVHSQFRMLYAGFYLQTIKSTILTGSPRVIVVLWFLKLQATLIVLRMLLPKNYTLAPV